MAKRKRLTPPDPARLEGATPSEKKSMQFPTYPDGVAPSRSAPIADVAGDAATVAALEDVSEELRRARSNGRMVLELGLDGVEDDYLVRDRVITDTAEMDSLKESLRSRGQQTPIEVADLGGGRYGLISGWRRLTALRDLAKKGGIESVLALVRQPETASDAYLAMVEENEIRVGLSYFERARIALKAVDQGVYPTHKAALLSLYHSASRPKRSKIRSFLSVVEALDGHLRFPAGVGERMGLAMSKALEADAGLAARLQGALRKAQPQSLDQEQRILEQIMAPAKAPKPAPVIPEGVVVKSGPNGSVILSGTGVTPQMRIALELWIKEYSA